jgi:hypothetical protein
LQLGTATCNRCWIGISAERPEYDDDDDDDIGDDGQFQHATTQHLGH